MNDNQLCLICNEELKPGIQLLTILVQGVQGFLLHKWCLDKLIEMNRGKNNVMQKL